MNKCEHIIGMLCQYEDTCTVTLNDLKEHIKSQLSLKKYYEENFPTQEKVVYSLSDYADKRKSTDLIRFDFCPKCGNKINWKLIKEMG